MADTRAIEGAIVAYASQTGHLPGSLEDLTRTGVNNAGVTVGPFLSAVPKPPAGSAPYRYEITTAGGFRVTGEAHGSLVEVGTGITTRL
jgi:hypothetical protein